MIDVTLREILDWTRGTLLNQKENFVLDSKFNDISTDSRNISRGDLFVALKGARFDGHKFLKQAIEKKAGGLIIDNDEALINLQPTGISIIRTENTLEAYQKIAAGYRKKLSARIVAVTGSVGKTMTRRMISSCLEAKMKVHQTHANLNNEIGLPQTILEAKPEHEALVLELGMRGLGEISLLSKICRPDIAVITNIGTAHIGRLGSRDNILKAKTEILDGMNTDGLLIINADDPLLLNWSKNENRGVKLALVFKDEAGIDLPAHEFAIRVDKISRSDAMVGFTACCRDKNGFSENVTVELALPGDHNISNALFGLAAARALNIDMEAAAVRLSECIPVDNRQLIIRQDEFVIMDDSYNAGPESMNSALLTMRDIARGKYRLVAVLGGMLELGEYALAAHRKLGEMTARCGYSHLFLIGEYAHEVAAGAREYDKGIQISCYENQEDLVKALSLQMAPGDHILIKGSRAYNLENVTDKLIESIRDRKERKEISG